jgi:3-(3-hydroxy-phenyl)propionate hydroxylase
VSYELDWTSIYTFQCRRMERFRHGHVIFAGDSAHQVSPFGARGANSGIQDVDNLAWKLQLVVEGKASDRLLDSYDDERVYGADENILNSTRSTDFITPKTPMSKLFRNAVLELAEKNPFARTLVNSGRLSLPCTYDGSNLNGADHADMPARTRPGSPCPDAPLADGWLLKKLGRSFTILGIGVELPETFASHGIDCELLNTSAAGNEAITARYLGKVAHAVYLIRPDQHVAARWDHFDVTSINSAMAKTLALG